MAEKMDLEQTIEEGKIFGGAGTEQDVAGQKVQFKEYLGSGTFSQRYTVELEGKAYFAKIFRHSSLASGSTSRDILRNEIHINTILRKEPDGPSLCYRGFVWIEDAVLVLYDDLIGQHQGDCLERWLFSRSPQPSREKSRSQAQQEIMADKNSYSLSEVVHLVSQVCLEADKLHADKPDDKAGIIHMDISPANILVGNDLKVTLIDFGIARGKDRDIKKLYNEYLPGEAAGSYYTTKSGILYNRIYSPPDIESYERADATLDTYNIANVLCLLLTGRLREYYQNKESSLETELIAAMKKRFVIDGKLSDEVTDEGVKQLAKIIIKGTSETRTDRYATARQLYDDLNATGIRLPERAGFKLDLPLGIPSAVANYQFVDVELSPLEMACSGDGSIVDTTLDRLAAEGKEQQYQKKHLFDLPGRDRSLSELIRKAKLRSTGSLWARYIAAPGEALMQSLTSIKKSGRENVTEEAPLASEQESQQETYLDSAQAKEIIQRHTIPASSQPTDFPLSPLKEERGDEKKGGIPPGEAEIVPIEDIELKKKPRPWLYGSIAAGLVLGASLSYALYEKYQHRIKIVIPAELAGSQNGDQK